MLSRLSKCSEAYGLNAQTRLMVGSNKSRTPPLARESTLPHLIPCSPSRLMAILSECGVIGEEQGARACELLANREAIRLTILATTRMLNGICIAGIDSEDKWIRPVPRDAESFTPSSLSPSRRVVVEPYDEVEFVVRRQLKNSPHSEDLEVDSSRTPSIIRNVGETALGRLMRRNDEHDQISEKGGDLERWLKQQNRSLTLTRVDEAVDAFRGTFDPAGGQRRIRFRVGKQLFTLPCTDLRWRASTRGNRDGRMLKHLRSAEVLYFALGLARQLNYHYYPMVVGVHPIPKLAVEVDYDDL
jgi:hypothetical protein